MFAFGMNGVAIGPNSQKNIDALKKADWLVVGEIYPDETSEFWKSPGSPRDEMKQIQHDVYRLPGAGFAEKDGSLTNSARWLQWKNGRSAARARRRPDQDIVARSSSRCASSTRRRAAQFPEPILQAHLGLHQSATPSLCRGR